MIFMTAPLNLIFNLISIWMGPYFYVYGFAMALLGKDLDLLENSTFMLQ